MVQKRNSLKGVKTSNRMDKAVIEQFADKGYFGPTVNGISSVAKASKASLYQKFPGGKDQMVLFAVQSVDKEICSEITKNFGNETDVFAALDATVLYFKERLTVGEFLCGTPLTAISLELSGTNSEILKECVKAVTGWMKILDDQFSNYVCAPEAKSLAIAIYCMMQGALSLSQTTKDLTHLDVASGYCASLIRDAVARYEMSSDS